MAYEVKDLKSLTVKEMLNAVSGMYRCIYIYIYIYIYMYVYILHDSHSITFCHI
jgi:hypothetical protein